MDTNLRLEKLRLKYLVEVYFPDLSIAYLSRRVRGDPSPDDMSRIRNSPMLKVERKLTVGDRAVRTYFDPDGPKPHHDFYEILCAVLAREFALTRPVSRGVDDLAQGLARYVHRGEGSPFAILFGLDIRASELTFEHLMPPIHRSTGGHGLEALSAVKEHQLAAEFLRGGPPVNWQVIRHVAIERSIERQIIETIDQGARLVILTGAAGEGKSTLLKRLGMGLRAKNWRVLLAEAIDRRAFPDLGKLLDQDIRTCVLVDNADMAVNFDRLEQNFSEKSNVCIVLCARTYQWNRRNFAFERAVRLEIPRVDAAEIDELADRILSVGANFGSKSKAELIELVSTSVRSEHPHLLAAMVTATRGIHFRGIIDGLIANFESAGDDWVLRSVAVATLLNDLSEGTVGLLPHRLLRQLIHKRRQAGDVREPAADYASRIIRGLSSEVIPIRVAGRRDPTEYELRHPDITYAVLEKYYGLIYREGVDHADPLSEAVCEFADAEFDFVASVNRAGTIGRLPYSRNVLMALLKAPAEVDRWFPRLISRELARAILTKFGAYESELKERAELLTVWADIEVRLPGGCDDGGRQLADILYEELVELQPGLSGPWGNWLAGAIARGRIGEWENPEPDTARYVARETWARAIRTSDSAAQWMALEIREGELGEVDAPAPFTARWIARSAWALGVHGERLARDWLEMERNAGNVGDFADPAAGTARWVAWLAWSAGERSESFLIAWLHLERDSGEFGDVDCPTKGSARWIAKEAWAARVWGESLIIGWLRMERDLDNLGQPAEPIEGSARWIAREAWRSGVRSEAFVLDWIRLEENAGNLGEPIRPAEWTARWLLQQVRSGPSGEWALAKALQLEAAAENLGDLKTPSEGSARWLARRTWVQGGRGPQFLVAAIQVESQAGNIGDQEAPAEWTARWFARQAWLAGVRNAQLVLSWFHLERESGNLGTFSDPQAGSVRWIARTAWAVRVRTEELLTAWLRLELQAGNLGESDSPAMWTGRWIVREGELRGLQGEALAIARLRMEAQADNLGDLDDPEVGTARWIARTLWQDGFHGNLFVLAWARLERLNGNIGAFERPAPYSLRWLLRAAASSSQVSFSMVAPILLSLEYEAGIGVVGEANAPVEWSARDVARKIWRLPNCHRNQAWRLAHLELSLSDDAMPEASEYSANWVFEQSRLRYGLDHESLSSWMAEGPRDPVGDGGRALADADEAPSASLEEGPENQPLDGLAWPDAGTGDHAD